jgi:hypothetical protein
MVSHFNRKPTNKHPQRQFLYLYPSWGYSSGLLFWRWCVVPSMLFCFTSGSKWWNQLSSSVTSKQLQWHIHAYLLCLSLSKQEPNGEQNFPISQSLYLLYGTVSYAKLCCSFPATLHSSLMSVNFLLAVFSCGTSWLIIAWVISNVHICL